jgi:hypothetical protein
MAIVIAPISSIKNVNFKIAFGLMLVLCRALKIGKPIAEYGYSCNILNQDKNNRLNNIKSNAIIIRMSLKALLLEG